MTKFSLSSYLMVSVLLILSGILSILFTQVDNNYEYPIFSPDLQREQNDIIQRIYQLQPEASEIQQEISSVTPEQLKVIREEAAIIQPMADTRDSQHPQQAVKAAPTAAKNNYNNAWSTFPVTGSEPGHFLQHNPWSPDYKPGS